MSAGLQIRAGGFPSCNFVSFVVYGFGSCVRAKMSPFEPNAIRVLASYVSHQQPSYCR